MITRPPALEKSTEPGFGQPQVNGNFFPGAGGPYRLNLGGRETSISGFLNVDCFEGPMVDVVSDITKLQMFEDGSVEEIYASHALEHSPHIYTAEILKEWRRVLKTGGKCFISVPDMDVVLKLFHERGLTEFLVHLIWGDQGYDMAYHYVGFTYPRLALLLIKAGFSDVKKIKWMPYKINDCSTLVDTIYNEPISLTVEAIA